MTVVTTADTSQLYALAARHGLKLHGPLTVNELGLDYRIVIATVDDGRRWVLRIPRRAEVSAKVEPEARVLAMLMPQPDGGESQASGLTLVSVAVLARAWKR